MNNQLISRQPIFNQNMSLFAYELMFFGGLNPDILTSEYLDTICGSHTAVINCTHLLRSPDFACSAPPDKLLFAIDVSALIYDEVKQNIQTLNQQGYQFIAAQVTDLNKLKNHLRLFNWIKLDFLALEEKALTTLANICKAERKPVIAEKVETHSLLSFAHSISCDYLQGNFLSRPDLSEKPEKHDANSMATMQLLQQLQNPDITADEVEATLSHDARLAYKLLLVVNSPAYGLTRKIESLREAIIRVGLQQIRRWANLIILSSVDKPVELTTAAMIRAKMCELLAEHDQENDASVFFTAGLLSTLDALFDKDMHLLLEELCLSETLNTALLKHEGHIGNLLKNVIAYERAEWDNFSEQDDLDYSAFLDAYIESVRWAEAYCNNLRGA